MIIRFKIYIMDKIKTDFEESSNYNIDSTFYENFCVVCYDGCDGIFLCEKCKLLYCLECAEILKHKCCICFRNDFCNETNNNQNDFFSNMEFGFIGDFDDIGDFEYSELNIFMIATKAIFNTCIIIIISIISMFGLYFTIEYTLEILLEILSWCFFMFLTYFDL